MRNFLQTVVFENAHVICVDKPAGVLTVPARDIKDTRPCLGLRIQQELKMHIYPVHRLDFEVSGLVIFAKNPQAHAALNRGFELRKVQKTYQAYAKKCKTIASQNSSLPIVEEFAVGQTLTLKNKILRGKKRSYESPNGDFAETFVECMRELKESCGNTCEFRLSPVTGRSHQLRLHLSQIGWPILGDVLYGADTPGKQNVIALRAIELEFKEWESKDSEKIKALGLPQSLCIPTSDCPLL